MAAREGSDPMRAGGWPVTGASGHSPFTLVLAGGGARGFAHVGVLRALERQGWRPSALVGVSMGAVVAATYALNPDWYKSLLAIDVDSLHAPSRPVGSSPGSRVSRKARRLWRYSHVTWQMMTGWGAGSNGVAAAHEHLRSLTRGRDLSVGRPQVAICATDLRTGDRIVLREGDAAEAAYASSALAGVVPPLERDDALLVDGAYADLAPIDVARSFGHAVLAVDPGQESYAGRLENGLQALVRAFEICHREHAKLRFAAADSVLRPTFRRPIDVLDFGARRECVAAGMRAVRAGRDALDGLLGNGGHDSTAAYPPRS